MNRRLFFAALAGAAPAIAASDPCPVKVSVLAGPSIEVVIPNLPKPQLVEIAATFLGRDKPGPTKDLRAQFEQAKHISVTLTTKCPA